MELSWNWNKTGRKPITCFRKRTVGMHSNGHWGFLSSNAEIANNLYGAIVFTRVLKIVIGFCGCDLRAGKICLAAPHRKELLAVALAPSGLCTVDLDHGAHADSKSQDPSEIERYALGGATMGNNNDLTRKGELCLTTPTLSGCQTEMETTVRAELE